MRPADVPEVAALDALIFAEHAWSRDAWANEARSLAAGARAYVVARRGSNLIGYAGIMRAGSDADVLTVAVSPADRDRGCGRSLVEALLEVARGWNCLAVFLEVEQGNAAAVRLYSGLGFSEIGQRRHYYGQGRHAVTMRRRLREPLGSLPLGGEG